MNSDDTSSPPEAPSPRRVSNWNWSLNGWTDATWAFLLLRLWLGLRWLLAGIEKFELNGEYSIENHSENMTRMGEGFAAASFLPEWLTKLYTAPLGYEQVLVGVLLLLGVKLRILLIVTGIMYLSLSFGLMVVAEDESIALLGIHMALTTFALLLARHQRLALWPDRCRETTATLPV